MDYELNHESSLHGYKELYGCFMTDPQIECSESGDGSIYAPLENGIFELVERKLHPHSPDQITFTNINAKYDPDENARYLRDICIRLRAVIPS